MAFGTLQIDPAAKPLEAHVLHKHFERKHGPRAYYGQPEPHPPAPDARNRP